MSKATPMEKTIKKPLVSDELAIKEIEKWLDYKQVDEQQREDQEAAIKSLVSYIKSGHLLLNDDHTFTHKLKFPIDSANLSELTYKARLQEKEISTKLQAVKSDDGDGRLAIHMCALTGQVIGIIRALDKEDFKIARAIAVFFV